MRSDFASMQMFHPERGQGGALRLLTFRGFSAEAAKFWEWVGADSTGSTCGAALRTGRRVVAHDVEQCAFMAGSEDLATYRATGIRSCQSTPLLARNGRIVGMISTHWRYPFHPTERQLGLLDVVARQAADFIERAQAISALRHRAAQHETLVNQSPLGIYLVDSEFRIREVNPVAVPVFGDIGLVGRELDEVAHTLWQDDYADEIMRIFRHTLQTGEPYFAPECAAYRIDRNTTEHYEWRLDRITLPDGRFGVVCHFRDIAAQVLARQTQQLLVEELNHRVKNTLASVQAIAQHTLRSTRDDPAEFASKFAGRVQSLARAHSLLTSTVWKGADLRDLIRDQLELCPIDQSRLTAADGDPHVAADGPARRLDAARARNQLGQAWRALDAARIGHDRLGGRRRPAASAVGRAGRPFRGGAAHARVRYDADRAERNRDRRPCRTARRQSVFTSTLARDDHQIVGRAARHGTLSSSYRPIAGALRCSDSRSGRQLAAERPRRATALIMPEARSRRSQSARRRFSAAAVRGPIEKPQ